MYVVHLNSPEVDSDFIYSRSFEAFGSSATQLDRDKGLGLGQHIQNLLNVLMDRLATRYLDFAVRKFVGILTWPRRWRLLPKTTTHPLFKFGIYGSRLPPSDHWKVINEVIFMERSKSQMGLP